jgi:hypothetical protein
MSRFRWIRCAVVLLPALAGCGSPALDNRTVENLTALKGPDGEFACAEFIAYEEGKRGAADPCEEKRFDEKSLRNVSDACECLQGVADGAPGVLLESCHVMIDAFLAYEHAKSACGEE